MKKMFQMLVFMLMSAGAFASSTDIVVPNGNASYSVVNTSYMQSFTATAANVIAGPEMRDTVSIFGSYNGLFPSLSPLNLTVRLYQGEGNTGALLDSTNLVLTSDNATVTTHYADVNYYAKGIILTVGQKYTLEWVTPDVMFTGMQSVNWWNSTLNSNVVNDPNSCFLYNAVVSGSGAAGGTWMPVSQALATDVLDVGFGPFTPGGYAGGNPGRDQTGTGISSIMNNDYGCQNGSPVIGDFAIHVIDQTPPVLPLACSGTATIVNPNLQQYYAMGLSNGAIVAYTNATVWNKTHTMLTGSTTVTTFSGIATTADMTKVGTTVTYTGVMDSPVGGYACLPTTLDFYVAPTVPVVTPTPIPTPIVTCTLPQVLTNGICTTPTVPVVTPTPIPTPVVIPTCTKPVGAKSFAVSGKINATGAGTLTIGTKLVTIPNCAKVQYEGSADTFGLGYKVELKGYTYNGINFGTSLVVDNQ
jgi:hypothetical protein